MVNLNAKDLVRHELTGLQAEVVQSSHRGLLGFKGKIVEESMKMLVISSGNGDKSLPKKSIVLRIDLPGGTKTEIPGTDLLYRPIERTKRGVRRQ